jgi:hypothetical protein
LGRAGIGSRLGRFLGGCGAGLATRQGAWAGRKASGR